MRRFHRISFFTSLMVVVITVNMVYADPAEILNLLGANRTNDLKEMRRAAEGVENMFLEAVFERDGARAADAYRSIWEHYRQHLLAWEALARLREYHFAIGEYRTAAALAETLNKRPPESIPLEKPKSAYEGNFWVQTGAFSNIKNAQALKRKLSDMGYTATIIQKKSGGRDLHLVRVGGFQSKDEARQAARKIEESLKIKTRLLVETR